MKETDEREKTERKKQNKRINDVDIKNYCFCNSGKTLNKEYVERKPERKKIKNSSNHVICNVKIVQSIVTRSLFLDRFSRFLSLSLSLEPILLLLELKSSDAY